MASGFLVRVPLVDGDFLCNVLGTCLISFVFPDTTILSSYAKQRLYLPTRVALTNPFTTTGSRSALWLRLSVQAKSYRYVPNNNLKIFIYFKRFFDQSELTQILESPFDQDSCHFWKTLLIRAKVGSGTFIFYFRTHLVSGRLS